MQILRAALYDDSPYLTYADWLHLISIRFTLAYRNLNSFLSIRLGLLQPHHSAISHCPVKPWRSTSEIVVETHPLPLWTTPLGCLVQVVTGASLQVSVPRVRLGCPAILLGVLVVLCFRFFVFTVAPKALPCVGFHHPLHHFGTV